MSVTFYIGCHKCGEHIWVGQNKYLYAAEKDTMEAMAVFLDKHNSNDITDSDRCQLWYGSEYVVSELLQDSEELSIASVIRGAED